MTQAVRCVVFDVDDTLYLERDYARSGFTAVGRYLELRYHVGGFGELAWELFERGARGTIFDAALAQLGAPTEPALIDELVTVYRDHEPAIDLLPDARMIVDSLALAGVSMAAITDGPVVSQQRKVAALELEQWMNPVVVTGKLGPNAGKPSPQGYELVQNTTGFGGRDCAYIADNPAKDFIAARALGWRTVRIRRAGGLHAEVPGGDDIDTEITSLDQLTKLPWCPA